MSVDGILSVIFMICLCVSCGILADGELGLYMDCNISSDCRTHAYCGPGRVCSCRETYVPDEKNVTCLAGIRQRCQYDDSCIPNAYCRHQERCECKEGYLPAQDLLHCQSAGSRLRMEPFGLMLVCLLRF